MKNRRDTHSQLICSISRAILGTITPNVRAVGGSLSADDVVDFVVIFDKPPTQEELSDFYVAGSEIVADGRSFINEYFITIESSKPPEHKNLEVLVYLRKE
ncbi:MAG: hypothetical protein SFZ03_10305 [Candidatus Melainabacteria bacterium]|nr:hypothetical protein [Candidatus Melainabacteria bacterium]